MYGPYAFFPLIAACVWLATLLGLIAIWVVDGKPQYSRGNAVVVFISDVGGAHKVRFCIHRSLSNGVLMDRNSSFPCAAVLPVSTFYHFSQRGG